MKSITIHNLEDPLDTLIRARARAEGLSLNRIIKKLLREALEQPGSGDTAGRKDFAEFLGVWNDSELRAFQRQVSAFDKIDPSEWQ